MAPEVKNAVPVPRGASLDDTRKALGKRKPAKKPSAKALAAFAVFGSAATDRQRINIELRNLMTGERSFWNADDALTGGLALGPGGGKAQADLDAAAGAAKRFLAAAESALPAHRTALTIAHPAPAGDPRANAIVLEWPLGVPAIGMAPLAAIAAGKPLPPHGKGAAPTPPAAAEGMRAAARDLAAAAAALARGYEVKIAVRTFDPAS